MNGKPNLRLMARSGVPVAALLLAQRRHAAPSAWTAIEYVMAASLSFATLAGGLYGASSALDMFFPSQPPPRAQLPLSPDLQKMLDSHARTAR